MVGFYIPDLSNVDWDAVRHECWCGKKYKTIKGILAHHEKIHHETNPTICTSFPQKVKK